MTTAAKTRRDAADISDSGAPSSEVSVRRGPTGRTLTAAVLLGAAIVGVAVAGLCRGSGWDSPATALPALFGHGDSAVVVQEWRAPRVAAGLLFGAALGVAGAVFQNLTRNPLGSPDIIGLDAGSYTGALLALTVFGGGAASVSVSAVAGGLAAAAIVVVLARGAGGAGLRLVVVGIGVNAVLVALDSWIILRADLEVAMAAEGWNTGSLNGLDWAEIAPSALVIAIGFALAGAASAGMHQSTLGDDLATATGVRLVALRAVLVAAGVCCAAAVTAAAGPVVFVALAAPQLARRALRTVGVTLTGSAALGALLLTGADVVAQTLLAPAALPVGVVTTAIGGAYLVRLLSGERRPR